MAETIAICNQKGGVGKTTTALNIGVGLVRQGKKVLLVDADPQSDLTTSLGFDADSLDKSLGRLMYMVTEDYKPDITETIIHHTEGVDLIPSNLELSSMETRLVNAMSREKVMANLLQDVKPHYDYILIDCIRDWDPSHERMSRGITLTEEQAEKLTAALVQRYRDKAERSAGAPLRDDMAR